jgi:CubicO group peptidase (beta-lactamase class C family)
LYLISSFITHFTAFISIKMMKLFNLLAVAYLFIITSNAAAQPPQYFTPTKPEEVGVSSERLTRLDTFLQGYVDKGIIPNAVTFIARKGKIVHHKTFGFSNLETKAALKKDAIFRIASQTKALTSIAVMMLYEEGKILLDEPIATYIPAFKNPSVLVKYDEKDRQKYETRPAKTAITIRHLLTHTAGIPYEHPLQDLPEFKVPFFASIDKETLADVIPKLAKRPLLSDPGEVFVYGLNTDILAHLVEIVSGTNFNEFLKTRILTPLSMNDTYFYLPMDKSSRLVELYSKENREDKLTIHANNVYRNFALEGGKSYFSGGAGLVSTIEDYAKICQLLLNKGYFNNKRLLSHSTVNMMTRNQIGSLEYWDRGDGFGFGFGVGKDQSKYYDPAAAGAFGWGGMYCSEYTIDPNEDLIALVFTNVHPFAFYGDFVKKFRVLVYQSLEKK